MQDLAPLFLWFLGYFEQVLVSGNHRAPRLVGDALVYADLSTFHIIEGLRDAFPNAMARTAATYPLLYMLRDQLTGHRKIAAYLASPGRLPFNDHGIFRHYAALDP